MSSLEFTRRVARWTAVAALTLGLTACLRPLYGPTASGEPLADVLGAIDVAPLEPLTVLAGQERLNHYLRSELIYALNGSGQPYPKRYKLTINAYGGLTTPLTDSTTGRADAVTIQGAATYTLVRLDGGKLVTQGRASGYAAYDRNPQLFASVRAARDAEIRLGKMLAEQIKIRLASALATDPAPGGTAPSGAVAGKTSEAGGRKPSRL